MIIGILFTNRPRCKSYPEASETLITLDVVSFFSISINNQKYNFIDFRITYMY